MASPEVLQAVELARAGRGGEALPGVERAAAAGDADALYLLGLWRLEGQVLPRDLVAARGFVAEAEAGGSIAAARTLGALLAAGVGGAADWPAALATLERWRDRDPLAARQIALIAAMPASPLPSELMRTDPEVRRVPDLFSRDEIRFLLEVSAPRFKPARVFDARERRFVEHPYRRADAAAFPVALEWPAVHALNRRIAAVTGTDVRRGEPLQLLRYAPGQEYRPHLDAVPGLANQRVLTALVALNDGYDGGETLFPELDLAWHGTVGEALIFRNTGDDGRPDPRTMHAGAAVRSGTKLIASRWIRAEPPAAGEAFGTHEAEA